MGRAEEIPRYVLLSDFQHFALYDLEPEDQLDLPLFRTRFRYTRLEFPLADLPLHVRAFAFIPGYAVPTSKPQDELNLKAVGIMARVHDTLRLGGYTGHELERFLVRVLFCLFADKTGIFQPESFRLFIENRTSPDGSNLGAQLNELFATLDKPEERRLKHLDADLRAFPYINGALFTERLDAAAFTGPMRQALLDACDFRWGEISPAIFGALFQEVINTGEDPKRRRKIGAHYTSERDILKVIRPLFLDKLRAEFEAIDRDRSGRRSTRLEDLRFRLTKLTFLDPACGCGNFLVVAYRELRSLELDILKAQHSSQQAFSLDEVNRLSQVDVHQFYGIEIEEWPARIAEVALWLMDHLANRQILAAFSQPFLRLPLRQSPHIHLGNALRMDWNDLLPSPGCSYVMGNPPFIGHHLQQTHQKQDQHLVLKGLRGNGVLDYVCNWYVKCAEYIRDLPIRCAFVSTNSITQGEQAGLLWNFMYDTFPIRISFAYRTFAWTSEAKGKAHVHVVIIGFDSTMNQPRRIFGLAEDGLEFTAVEASSISPYLIDGPERAVLPKLRPSSQVPPMLWGSKPTDGGNFILDDEERREMLDLEPQSAKWIRPYTGATEFLNGPKRWCLWLNGISPGQFQSMPLVMARVARVRDMRKGSTAPSTRRLANTPTRFAQVAQPDSDYLLIPLHTSETRKYLPIAFMPKEVIVSNACSFIPSATPFLFGILSSLLHTCWLRLVGGRIKSDIRYSSQLVYNNFPWPESPTDAHRTAVEREAQAVLDARVIFAESNLATLYDPVLMPPELVKAHGRLDRAVERCYRPQPFTSDRERAEVLFSLYERLAAPLLPSAGTKKTRRKSQKATAP